MPRPGTIKVAPGHKIYPYLLRGMTIFLAKLTDAEYAAIGRFTRQVLDECHRDFEAGKVAPTLA